MQIIILPFSIQAIMGRYYGGDIEGKFWFGVQNSWDISNLVDIKYSVEYMEALRMFCR